MKIDKSLYVRMGELLRSKREERGYSLEQVAEAVGLTKKTIQRYETAESRITTDNLKKICDFMGIDTKEVSGFFVFHLSQDGESEDEVRHIDYLKTVETISVLEDRRKVINVLSKKPELFKIYLNIYDNKALQELYSNLDGLSDQDLMTITTIVRGLRKGRSLDYFDMDKVWYRS